MNVETVSLATDGPPLSSGSGRRYPRTPATDPARRNADRAVQAGPRARRPPAGGRSGFGRATAAAGTGRWQRAADDAGVDAALLLAAIRGAVPADDPRSVATLRTVQAGLCQDGYAYRFRPDVRPLGEAEGAFLLCGFLVALAVGQQGDAVGAARWFERNRAACGPPGLLSEEYDVRQRQTRGNLPQAFVHALLLECAAAQG
jgi:alpha,alpha-trehalase